MPPMNAEEMEKLASKVSKLIASNQVTVFSKTYCPYCTNAKNAFRKLGKEFKAIELDEESMFIYLLPHYSYYYFN
ncbi:thioredoxin reductase [Coelomomyces lativittatus]|nr:thioredoxin reductase [Coelomomyces lativittatus]